MKPEAEGRTGVKHRTLHSAKTFAIFFLPVVDRGVYWGGVEVNKLPNTLMRAPPSSGRCPSKLQGETASTSEKTSACLCHSFFVLDLWKDQLLQCLFHLRALQSDGMEKLHRWAESQLLFCLLEQLTLERIPCAQQKNIKNKA